MKSRTLAKTTEAGRLFQTREIAIGKKVFYYSRSEFFLHEICTVVSGKIVMVPVHDADKSHIA